MAPISHCYSGLERECHVFLPWSFGLISQAMYKRSVRMFKAVATDMGWAYSAKYFETQSYGDGLLTPKHP